MSCVSAAKLQQTLNNIFSLLFLLYDNDMFRDSNRKIIFLTSML